MIARFVLLLGVGLLALAPISGCREATVAQFLTHRATRRASLAASLVDAPAHLDYRARRLAHYATDVRDDARSWEALPEWNPPVAALGDASAVAAPLTISDAARAGDERALVELGRIAFTRYPAQRAAFDVAALPDSTRGMALVRVNFADGSSAVALTCATCHSNTHDGRTEMGAANHALDLGAWMIDAPLGRRASIATEGAPADPVPLTSWGPGRVDVTTREGTEPALIPDLRPVRFQRNLQHSGAVAQRDVTSLAVRIETLIITAHDDGVRPPRDVALGLALYLWSLADALPPLDRSAPGASVFTQHCARCHAGEGLAGGLVDVDTVGTDAKLARSRDRGTGSYRTTSLRGVGSRDRLLHDGSVRSLDELLDPARTRGGHRYGTELASEPRRALITWLRGQVSVATP